LWPNPNPGTFMAAIPSDAEFRLVNAGGVNVPFRFTQTDGILYFNLNHAETGIYYLLVHGDDFSECVKVLVL